MAVFDEFSENYEILIFEVYKKHQQYPITVKSKLKRSSGGIYCRNGQALKKLRQVEKELGLLNNEILKFFGIDECLLRVDVGRRKRGRPKNRRS